MLIQYITKGSKIANRPEKLQITGNWGQHLGVMVGYTTVSVETGKKSIHLGFSLKNKKEPSKIFDKKQALELAIAKSNELSSLEVFPENR